MSTSKIRLILLILGVLILVAAGIAVLKRDKIADLILRGSDVSLADEAARTSPQGKLALDFLGALRAMDKEAIAQIATAEQIARIEQETQQPSGDFQEMRTMMLDDLPADPGALRNKIKTVQTHGNRAVVLFETKANSWYVQLVQEDNAWKISGF